MNLSELTAVSPIDGRYGSKTRALRALLSEFGLIKSRFIVEVEWLKQLSRHPAIEEVPEFDSSTLDYLDHLISDFSEADAARVKAIEANTNHDVKAVEYFLKKVMPCSPVVGNSYILPAPPRISTMSPTG